MSAMRGATALGLTVVVAAAGLSACHPVRSSGSGRGGLFSSGPMKVVARLDCPDTEGRLTRVSETPDGRSCRYTGDRGEAVTLSLVALNGETPQAALTPIEADLKGPAAGPVPSATPAPKSDHDGDDDEGVTTTTTTTTAHTPTPPAVPKADEHRSHEHANIDLPFIHIHSDGDKADVRLPGVSVHSNGDDAQVKTSWGMKNTTINAHGGGAEIRAGDVNRNGANLVYILASNTPDADGYKARGYIARGPAAGPLVVGVFKAKEGHHDSGGGRDLERLLERNLHG